MKSDKQNYSHYYLTVKVDPAWSFDKSLHSPGARVVDNGVSGPLREDPTSALGLHQIHWYRRRTWFSSSNDTLNVKDSLRMLRYVTHDLLSDRTKETPY